MTAQLVDIETRRQFPVAGRAVIGRGEGCEIRLDDPMVSATHAEIVRSVDGSFEVRDMGSRRGTYVGSRKVAAAPLRDGDEILVGPFRLRFDTRGITAPAMTAIGSTGSGVGGAINALTGILSGAVNGGPPASGELAQLRAIVELGRAIGVEHDLERLAGRVIETCFQLLPADRGAIVLYGAGGKTPSLTVTKSRAGDADAFAVSTSLMSQLMGTREPYLRTEIDADVALQRAESLSAHGVRSVMAVPLRYEASVDAAGTEWLGVILLDSRAMDHLFAPADLQLLVAIAGQIALAVKNAMLVRRMQTVIADEWRRFARVVRELPVGVVVLDAAGTCVLANPWATAREALIGPARAGEVLAAVAGIPFDQLAGGEVRRQVTPPGTDRTLSITASTSSDERETVVVIHDVTEAHERQSQEAHRDRVQLIGQLAGGIAHDFNNLLVIILSNANLLTETLTDPEAREDAAQIGHAAESAAELTRQLLTFSRRERVQSKVIDVARALSGMDKMLARTLGSQVALSTTVDARVPRILMDPAQLEQVVMNLVINARDAMPTGGHVRVTATAYTHGEHGGEQGEGPRSLAPGRYVLLEVADDGAGIPPDVLARVFEPYFTTKPRGKGTGLGLATVSGIVDQAGGTIAVDSRVGVGTIFRVYLPATEHAGEEPRRRARNTWRGGTVLLVDDDADVRRLTERILRRSGYEVLTAGSGAEALEIMRAHAGQISLLVSDMVMPGMSGRELAAAMSAEWPGVRVLFVSGYHRRAQHGYPFLPKPFDRDALLDAVHETLGGDPPDPPPPA